MPLNDHWTPFSREAGPGRPKGSRSRLTKQFFTRLSEDFEEHGVEAIARMRFHDPAAYVAVIAKLMPAKLEVSTPTEGMSDERLEHLIELAERMAALKAGAENDAVTVDVAPKLLSNHEKPIEVGGAEGWGEGPDRAVGPRPKKIAPTTPDTIRPSSPIEPSAETAEKIPGPQKSGPASQEDHLKATGIPHPVGRPSSASRPCHDCGRALAASQITRCDRCERMHGAEIDPVSLF